MEVESQIKDIENRLNEVKAFLQSRLYQDFITLQTRDYNIAFRNSCSSNYTLEQRVCFNERMQGIGDAGRIFVDIKVALEEELESLRRSKEDE